MAGNELRDTFVAVMTPSHDGRHCGNDVGSVLDLSAQLQGPGVRIQVFLHQGESLVTRACNDCVARFPGRPAWTHLCWIDSDFGFSTQAALRLLRGGHDAAAGAYPLKTADWPYEGLAAGTPRERFETLRARFPVNCVPPGEPGETRLCVQPDGFLRVSEARTGCMLIARSAFDRPIAACPDLRHTPDTVGLENNGLFHGLFDLMVDRQSRRHLSGDHALCRRCSAIGREIHVDARSSLSHQGPKTYRGSFAGSLAAALPRAVGSPNGTRLHLTGAEHLVTDATPAL